ncbi:MAG: HI0074 family nucleotidyltransferase substrate-binding subunit [Thermoguttaceae bacterium]
MSLELSNFEKAIVSFEKSLSDHRLAETTNLDQFLETLRAGVIQNFEFTYEQSWKLMMRWLEENRGDGLTFGITKKQLYRYAAENGLIDNFNAWVVFHEARNKTSHLYSGEIAEDVYQKAVDFLPHAKSLLKQLKEHNE